ncbi:hypothetical protein HMPREF9520_00886 [Enterococcus faecalis TX1467]|nr:hypothetical protein HMPREF9520_00886 [Enterococcus faecalis TX1467]
MFIVCLFFKKMSIPNFYIQLFFNFDTLQQIQSKLLIPFAEYFFQNSKLPSYLVIRVMVLHTETIMQNLSAN